MKILFLSRWFPYPADNGSKLRILNLLRGLKQNHDVTLLSFSDQPQGETDVPLDIRSLCSEIYTIPWREYDPHSRRAKLGLLSLKPRSLVDTFSLEMAGKISELINTYNFDLVIASQLSMAAYHPYFGKTPAIFEELEVGLSLPGGDRPAFSSVHLRHSLTWIKSRAYLRQLVRRFCAVTVASEMEKQLILQNFPGVQEVVVIPNCLNLDEYQDVCSEPKPDTLIFAGSFRYHVNYEAMQWFVGQVFPLILDKIPGAKLIITGDHADLPLPDTRNVMLVGYVNDIKSLIASSTVALAPLWSGGGTRLKILESLALGTPVVSTSKGAEGLDVVNGKTALLADTPAEFANAVICLLENRELHQNLSEEGRKLVRERYSYDGMSLTFKALLQNVAVRQ